MRSVNDFLDSIRKTADYPSMMRPLPPPHLQMPDGSTFEPAADLRDFLFSTFIAQGGAFHREEYAHLAEAKIGVLWTNRERIKDGLRTLGMAQLYRASGDKWTAGIGQQQILRWFSSWWEDPLNPFPDFVLYFYAPAVAQMNDPTACALFAHELRHCAQKRDRWGEPMFDDLGDPVFAIQGHDVSEFVSVIEDFGVAAAGPQAVKFVEAAQRAPRFSAAGVAGVCGCGAQLLEAA